MIDREIQALIHKLELTTKKQISGPLLSDWESSAKGSGFEFHQLRDYIQGDDIRFIDWKASARSQKMLVRQYLEDRNRVVYIVVDCSDSTYYGTGKLLKTDLIKRIATVLSFVSHHRKDSVGLILFTSEVEKVIPPRQGRTHLLGLLQELFTFKPQHKGTNISVALEYIARLRSQRSIICFISDFAGTIEHRLLSVISRQHECMAFRCLDERELAFPDVGTLIIEDKETGQQMEIEGSLNQRLVSWNEQQRQLLASNRIDCLDLIAQKSFTGPLVRFLRERMFQ